MNNEPNASEEDAAACKMKEMKQESEPNMRTRKAMNSLCEITMTHSKYRYSTRPLRRDLPLDIWHDPCAPFIGIWQLHHGRQMSVQWRWKPWQMAMVDIMTATKSLKMKNSTINQLYRTYKEGITSSMLHVESDKCLCNWWLSQQICRMRCPINGKY